MMANFDRFFSKEESELSRRFLKQGYLITEAENYPMLNKIQQYVADAAAGYLNRTVDNPLDFLNRVHDCVEIDELNSMRLYVIDKINTDPWLREGYFSLARKILETIVGNELAMQLRVNLSVQLPGDQSSVLPVHADVWSGDSPFEVVVWVPLVDCYDSKTMFLLPPEPTLALHDRFAEFQHKTAEQIYDSIVSDLSWIKIKFGEVLVFNQNLPHGNRVNEESETRWSMNCRFKSVFSPYRDKKLGEFFSPITLRAATRIGMDYRYPKFR